MIKGLNITPELIRRRYILGLDSIIRLVTDLTDRIEDLTALNLCRPKQTIQKQTAEIKRLKQTIYNKDIELTQVQQLNCQLQSRLRELEKCLEADTSTTVKMVTTINRDSHNSNQPPSLDLPWKKPKRTRSLRQRTGLNNGGQPGHPGATLSQVSLPDQIIIHPIENCSQCCSSLRGIKPTRFFRRQVFEIKNGRQFVIEHRTPLMTCPLCGNVSKGKFPFAITAPVQYGTSVLSCAVYLHLYQLLPLARTQEAMRDLFGCSISQASINRAARLCSDKLIYCEQRIKAAIRDSGVIGADETGIRINGTNAWVHVARTDSLTHLASHTKRGKAAFDAIGILNQYQGTLVRDGWFSYKQYQQCQHSLCNAHLLRDLTYISEAEPLHEQWTTDLAKLLLEIKSAVEKAKRHLHIELEKTLQNEFFNRYDSLLAEAETTVRGSPTPKSSGLTAKNLLNRFIKNKAEILRFMADFSVPFDNNGSERDLRMLKLQQKIGGCFRTTLGVTAFCRVRSYLSSARKQGKNLLTAIEHALNGKPISLTT